MTSSEMEVSLLARQGEPGVTPWPVTTDYKEAKDRELQHATEEVTAQGYTTLWTPTSGKKVRLWSVSAFNDPSSASGPAISIFLGTRRVFIGWFVSKSQMVTGAVDVPLRINLSKTGMVLVTAILEEV